jgi:hypothetical protein
VGGVFKGSLRMKLERILKETGRSLIKVISNLHENHQSG